MTFSSGGNDQKWFKEDMVYVTTENIREAHSFVESIAAYGGIFISTFYIDWITVFPTRLHVRLSKYLISLHENMPI